MNRQRLLKYASRAPLFEKRAWLATAGKLIGAGAFAYPALTDNHNHWAVEMLPVGPAFMASAAGGEFSKIIRPTGKLATEAGNANFQGEVAQRLSRQPVLAQPDGAPTIMSAARSGSRATGVVPPPQPPRQVA